MFATRVGVPDPLEQARGIRLDDPVAGGPLRPRRPQDVDVQVRPGPALGLKSRLEGRASHQNRPQGLLKLWESVALAGHEARVGELNGQPVRSRHVAIEARAETRSDGHRRIRPPRVTELIAYERD